MKSFSSRLTSGRGVTCPPAFLPSRGRRPAREIATRELRSEWSISKPGQALPPPTGPSGRASQLEARPGPATAHGHRSRASAATRRLSRDRIGAVALLRNFARNSPASVSRYELKVLKLQRFRTLLKVHAIK